MAKQRRQTITNTEIINKLTNAGLVPESRYGTNLNKNETRYRYELVNKLISYKIPVNVYNEIIGKKFNVKFKLGNMVRFRLNSTRQFHRKSWKQDIGDIYSWGSLGIGSGKTYEDLDMVKKVGRLWLHEANKVALGNWYTLNRKFAINKAHSYNINPDIYTKAYHSSSYNTEAEPMDFYKKKKLDHEGILGSKKLINGVVSEVFVHFIYPKWEQKREARYDILWETGARGIFTGDKLDRVFDTDFDIDERVNQCLSKCTIRCCPHKEVHIHTKECDKACAFGEGLCQPIYDYTNLRDLTVGKGSIIDEEEEK